MLELARPEPARRVTQLEGPEEIAGLLEVGSHGHDLVDQVFEADDAVLAQVLLDEAVVSQWNALFVDFAVAALVDEFADRLDGRVAVCDEGFDHFEHFDRGFGEFDEDTVVDLE